MTREAVGIHVFRPGHATRLRLVCCPYAGASATALADLARALPADIEALTVEYGSRHDRDGQAGFQAIEELADQVSTALGPWTDEPLAVYGHSMEPVVAFEVTRRLEAAGTKVPRLFVSGRRSPSAGLGPGVPGSDEEIIAELSALGGLPAKLLGKPKFLEYILGAIRHDYGVNSRYLAPLGARVLAPVTVLLADSDAYIDLEGALGWRQHSTGDFRVVHFPGGHFFFTGQLSLVVDVIAADLGELPAIEHRAATGAGGD